MDSRKKILLVIISILILIPAMGSFAQKEEKKDTSAQKKSNPFSDSSQEVIPVNFKLIDPNLGNSILNFKPQVNLLGFKSNVNNYFDPLNKNKKKVPNFMSQSNSEDSDILVKKYFNGKDMSNTEIVSNFSLGTLETQSKTVKIEVRDHSLVDGDRIKVYLNEQVLNSNIMLNGISYIINIELKKGYNRIDIEALNEGYSGPNTAELKVFDEQGYLLSERDWNISTGNFATLGIIKN